MKNALFCNTKLPKTSQSNRFENRKSSLKNSYADDLGLITKIDLSKCLSISVRFIDKLMTEEGLSYYKIGKSVRFKTSEVMEFLERRKRP